ncbi:gluconate 2-dehydrogenase subunit 3 family protein [Streptomyces platensis]|uniref:gluconate 2-dehydrogenase subunit 3 family protein n=1 Tax=Streptomyces platensis TaxID=58346 RepID=UPI0037936CC2
MDIATEYDESPLQQGELRSLFFTPHETAVVREATARLIPGPRDDQAEPYPGAREADVVRYIDRLLGAFTADPPLIYPAPAGQGGFLPLTPAQRVGWRRRIDTLQRAYRAGTALLDRLAGGDFTAVPAAERDAVLDAPQVREFRGVLFDHAIQGLYAAPVYRDATARNPGGTAPHTALGLPGGGRSVAADGPTAALAGRFEEAVRQLVAGVLDE